MSLLKIWALDNREKTLVFSVCFGIIIFIIIFLVISYISKVTFLTLISENKNLTSLALLLSSLPTLYFLWLFRTYDVKSAYDLSVIQKATDLCTSSELRARGAGLEQILDIRKNSKNQDQIAQIDRITSGINLANVKGVRTNLTGADLSGADLAGADLTRADLAGANLIEAKLTGAKLTGADLTEANLSGANLIDANLIDANLTGADLTEAILTGANLTRVDLTEANFTGADFTGADLTGARH